MKPDEANAWLTKHVPGQTLRAFVQAASTMPNSDGSSVAGDAPYDIKCHGRLRGLDDGRRLVYHQRSVCLFLTDGHLHVSSAGGQFRVRPKELLHTIERPGLRCQWFDYEELKTRIRNFLFLMPNGEWMGVGTQTRVFGKEKKSMALAETFVSHLGDSAIDWRDPPPL